MECAATRASHPTRSAPKTGGSYANPKVPSGGPTDPFLPRCDADGGSRPSILYQIVAGSGHPAVSPGNYGHRADQARQHAPVAVAEIGGDAEWQERQHVDNC